MTAFADIKQQYLGPLFIPTNNAGVLLDGEPIRSFRAVMQHPILLDYKGPHASDKPIPSDVQERVHRNAGSRKAKEHVSVAGPRWVEKHPDIYALFVKFTLQAIAQGMKIGAKAAAERVRWETPGTGAKPYKVANIAVTYMAVKFEEEHPQHAGFFKINKRK